MSFRELQDNEGLKEVLSEMIASGHVPHALLFEEEDGGGAFPICMAFLQALYCQNRDHGDACGQCSVCGRVAKLIHPDIYFIFPSTATKPSSTLTSEFRDLAIENPHFKENELNSLLNIDGKNTSITVSDSKYVIDALSITGVEGGYRSVIIYLPEKMNAEAANKLLKLIEEPPQLTQFLLISHNSHRVLPTIYSRCQRFSVHSSNSGNNLVEFESPELFFELMDALVANNLLTCLLVGEKIAALPSRESIKAFCKYAAGQIRHIFLIQQGLSFSFNAGDGGRGDSSEIERYAASLVRLFPRKALSVLDRTLTLIDRNVNSKLAVTDMVDRLYKSL